MPRTPHLRSDEDLPPTDPRLAPALLRWFGDHGRHFPWREIRDPFLILSVELMLQRTRASQVEPVFLEFRDHFESPSDVLAAGRPAVDEIFGQLGLRWRAEHFWRLQQALAERDGEPPHSLRELEALPGVGAYAAAAVAVFAYGASRTVVDANVLRVLGRYYGIEFDDGSRRRRRVLEWASEHAPAEADECRAFNWALLDLGAEVCTPSNPDCQICPIASQCQLRQERLRELNGAVDGG